MSDLKLHRIRLLTNHPRKVAALEGFDIEIVDQVPVSARAESSVTVYLSRRLNKAFNRRDR